MGIWLGPRRVPPPKDHTTATGTTTTLELSFSSPKVVLKKTALTAYLPVFYEVQAVRDERAGEALTYNPMLILLHCDGVVCVSVTGKTKWHALPTWMRH